MPMNDTAGLRLSWLRVTVAVTGGVTPLEGRTCPENVTARPDGSVADSATSSGFWLCQTARFGRAPSTGGSAGGPDTGAGLATVRLNVCVTAYAPLLAVTSTGTCPVHVAEVALIASVLPVIVRLIGWNGTYGVYHSCFGLA